MFYRLCFSYFSIELLHSYPLLRLHHQLAIGQLHYKAIYCVQSLDNSSGEARPYALSFFQTDKVRLLHIRPSSSSFLSLVSRCDHDGHSTSPIEVVNSRKRKLLEDEILPEIESRAKSLRVVIDRSLAARLDQYERLKREGDQRVEEVKRTMTEAWDRECRAQTDFAACFSNSLRELESTADQLKDATDDARLNRLVDRLPARDGEIPFDIVMKLADVDNVQLADWPNQIKPMNVLHPWLPGWDVEVR